MREGEGWGLIAKICEPRVTESMTAPQSDAILLCSPAGSSLLVFMFKDYLCCALEKFSPPKMQNNVVSPPSSFGYIAREGRPFRPPDPLGCYR